MSIEVKNMKPSKPIYHNKKEYEDIIHYQREDKDLFEIIRENSLGMKPYNELKTK